MDPQLEALLQRNEFDWGEEIEEEIQEPKIDHASIAVQIKIENHNSHAQLNASNIAHHSSNEGYNSAMQSITSGTDSIELDEPSMKTMVHADTIGHKDQVKNATSNVEDLNTTSTHVCNNSDDDITCMTCISETIDTEFSSRRVWTQQNPQTHHFNIDGKDVLSSNATTPAECLAVIMSRMYQPEAPPSGDYRIRSIINRARVFLDPVVTVLDQKTLFLRGSKLAEKAQGKTHKCYSEHGWWQLQVSESENISVLPDDPEHYLSTDVLYAGGFLNSPDIDFAKTCNDYERLPSYRKSPKGHDRKANFKRLPSPLGACEVQKQ